MKLKIRVYPNSPDEKIEKISDTEYKIWIKEKRENNKANISLLKLLQRFFKKKVKIKSGFSSQKKIIEVFDEI
ncbi:hypothetical protein DRN69_01745 [Candidatus Pacearchaeota archaeon]|nr:MAG: hypothetical protein DRN69_01745 [Candidatus Pacearchaeota archaeon]